MKRLLTVITTLIAGLVVLLIAYRMFWFVINRFYCPDNPDVVVEVESIGVRLLEELEITGILNSGCYSGIKLSKDDLGNFKENPENYKIIEFVYKLSNHSKTIQINSVKVFPQFSKPIQQKVVAFDPTGIISAHIYMEPEYSFSLPQNILFDTSGYSDEEMIGFVKSGQIQFVYYTGDWENVVVKFDAGKKTVMFDYDWEP